MKFESVVEYAMSADLLVSSEKDYMQNKTRVEFATGLLVLRLLGIGVFTLPRAQQLGFDASFLNAMSVRIAVVLLHISF
jgi:hypothetical protein